MDNLISLAVEVNSAYEACLEAGVESSKICSLKESVELACGLLNSGMAMEALDVASKYKIDISEESLRELGKKAIDAIVRLIEKVVDFFKSLIAKIKAFFTRKSEVEKALDELAREVEEFSKTFEATESLALTEVRDVVVTIEKYVALTRECVHAANMASRANHEICACIKNWLSSGDAAYITKNLSNVLYLEGGPTVKLVKQMDAVKDTSNELSEVSATWKTVLKAYLDPKVASSTKLFKSMRDEFFRNASQADVSSQLNKIKSDLKSTNVSTSSDVYQLVTCALTQCTSNYSYVMSEFCKMEHRFARLLKKKS